MWIRSQDGKTILDMLGCTLGVNFENKICGMGNNSSDEDHPVLLGEYPTEERAIEILEEICMFYIGLNSLNSNAAYVKNGVFRMPEV